MLPDPLDERYRWCIHCRADCWPEPQNQQHQPDCPSVTGLWPVDPGPYGVRCMTCETELHTGDVYALLDYDTGRPVTVAPEPPGAGVAVCIGCAALAMQ